MSAPVVLVTGITSSIGKAIVRRLAFAGCKVAAADKCPTSVNEVAEENKKVGGNVVGFAVDVNDKKHRSELIQRVVQEMGGLDSLVIVPPDNTVRGDIMDTTVKQFEQVFNDRLTVPFRLTKEALPALKKSKQVFSKFSETYGLNLIVVVFWNGSVVYLTSCAGYTPGLDIGLFSAASTGVLSLTKNVAANVAKDGVRVNSVCFGMVRNDGSGSFWDTNKSEEGLQQLQSMIPLGRLGRPSDAASLVQFLISPRAR
ncbi:unnamed protein product [Nippostrongylus brasiliensis]|uniref:NAD(P)-binding protein n=1 Tax=Nippostrongylus brasiliensis TaxID=27835 RepID=A0A0N4XV97_NIPBR|nr:unnamed protein product [Nippostrongylus brasiliensis]